MNRPDVSVVILTLNEARHIQRAIDSVRSFAREVIVIDSFSADDTVALAEAAGARVLQHPFENQARQYAWGLEHGQPQGAWTLRLDADEVIEPDLAATIARELPKMSPNVVGITFDRKHIFMGRWIRHGGRYPLRLLRLWRTGQGRVEDRWMDEHVEVWGGRVQHMAGGFADHNLTDLGFFTDKHNRYATREAMDVLGDRYGLWPSPAQGTAPSSQQARTKRFIKQRVYNRLPLWAGPLAYFLYRYVVQGGFLDGRPGLIYHVLQGFWYRSLAAAKLWEFDRELAPLPDAAARRARLSEMSGYHLDKVAMS